MQSNTCSRISVYRLLGLWALSSCCIVMPVWIVSLFFLNVEYIYGFVWSAGLQTKSMTSQRYRAAHKMADMRYYGNVTTTTRWRLYVTLETLWQQQDGGYALLWKRFLHLQQYSHRLNFNLFLTISIAVYCHRFILLLE